MRRLLQSTMWGDKSNSDVMGHERRNRMQAHILIVLILERTWRIVLLIID